MAEAVPAKISYAAYLAAEETREIKHEYLDGVERAMAGGTIDHAGLAARMAMLLGNALGDRPCRVFSSDARVRIVSANRSVYPDLTIVFGKVERAADDDNGITNPVVIVEVLSESSERYDRGEKFRYYKRLTSLQEYVLVSQGEPLVEVFRRTGEGWTGTDHGPGSTVSQASLDVTFSVDELYRDPLAAPR